MSGIGPTDLASYIGAAEVFGARSGPIIVKDVTVHLCGVGREPNPELRLHLAGVAEMPKADS
jgi:hypothetical protein